MTADIFVLYPSFNVADINGLILITINVEDYKCKKGKKLDIEHLSDISNLIIFQSSK